MYCWNTIDITNDSVITVSDVNVNDEEIPLLRTNDGVTTNDRQRAKQSLPENRTRNS